MRGKDNWNVFGAMLAAASAKQLTAEQFAVELAEDVKYVRQDYQSYLIKVEKAVKVTSKAKYAQLVADVEKHNATVEETGEGELKTVTKTETEYVTGCVEKTLNKYHLKSAKGRKATELDIEIELDDEV
jgi:alpha-glucosidase (family GH31 glycosyl hydrolase)